MVGSPKHRPTSIAWSEDDTLISLNTRPALLAVLEQAGVSRMFVSGTSLSDIADYVGRCGLRVSAG